MPFCPECRSSYPNGQFCPKDGAQLQPEEQPTLRGRAVASADTDPLVGQLIADRWRVIARLGAGGMGTVYEAEHKYIDKRVALKLLKPEVTASPDAVTRFQREALAASTIGHQNIVTIDDFGRLPDGQVYLTMEFLDGQALSDVLEQGVMPLPQLVDVAVQTCHGLAAAHAKGIIHRDMKPENIYIVEDGTKVKILDFGIAKVVRADSNTNLTKTGTVFGTPNYMAPEQALGRKIDHRADVYAMGIILYQMATGRLPFEADSFVAILTQHVTAPPPPPRTVAAPEREIPAELEQLILKAIAKDPAERFQDMGEMVAALLAVRRSLVGDAPLQSALRLSRIRPPSAPISAEPSRPGVSGKGVTATAGELVGPAIPVRRRAGLLVALTAGGLLLCGASIAAYFVLRSPPPAVAAGPGPAAGSAPAAGSGAGSAVASATRKVKVFIVSDPLGAEVERDGRSLGQTATSIDALAGEKFTVTLRRKGYQPRTIEIEASDGLMKTIPLERDGKTDKPRSVVTGRVAVKARVAKKKPKAPNKKGGGSDGDHGGEVLNPYEKQ
jgi:serine/threonine-protein kinase